MQTEEVVHLQDYYHVLKKRKWTVITFFVIVVTIVAVASFKAKPVFLATAQILIERENQNVVSIQDVLAIDPSNDFYQTQYELLKSEMLARRVIKKLELETDPEFSPNSQRGLLDFFGKARNGEGVETSGDRERRVIKQFLSALQIRPVRNSRLVKVGFESHNPKLAARVANGLAEEYITYNLELKFNAVQQAGGWLQGQVEEMQAKVREAEEAFEVYKENIPGLIIKEVQSRGTSKAAREEMESRPEVVNNEFIQKLRGEEIHLSSKLSELSQKYGPKHPQIIQLKSELRTLRSKIDREVKRIVGAIKIEESSEYLLLKREAETNRELYEVLLKRLKETILTENLPRSNIQIVDLAQVPQYSIKPKKRQNMMLAVIVGLTMGMGLAFFFEYLDNTIKGPEDIERVLGAPLLGLIPVAPREKDVESQIETVVLNEPRSSYAEAYRTIRTGVLLSSAEHQPKVILVTSPSAVEGKTTTAVNLAISMAQAGSSTLLMDADLRKPRIHRIFVKNGAPVSTKGLCPLLVGEAGVEAAIRETPVPLLSILEAGNKPPNPAELLGSNRMKELVGDLSEKFDRIIIDSPPLIPVTDATLLATICDGVVLVIKESQTTRQATEMAGRRLAEAKAKLLGVVLNEVDTRKSSSYYYSYYRYYGTYGEDSKSKGRGKD